MAYALALVVDGEAMGGVAISDIEHRHDTDWASYWLAGQVCG
jgi:hypothetical protein